MDPQADPRASFDLKLVSDILMQMNIVRKNTVLYPRGHPQLEASLSRIAGFLEQHFQYHPDLTLAVTRDSLILGEWEMPRTNPIFQELAAHLHERSIYQISLAKGVTGDEIHIFCRVLSGDPLVIERGEDLVPALTRHGVTHLSLSILDVSQFEFSEESEVDLDEQLATEGKSGASWQNYIRALLEKGVEEEAFTQEEDGIELTNVDPVLLSQLLNRMERQREQHVSYDRVVANYVRELGDPTLALEQVKDTQVKENFLALVSSLNAELRGALLSRDFEFSARSRYVSAAVFDCPAAKILLDALSDINRWGMKIDPRILTLVDRLASLDADTESDVCAPAALDEDEEHDFSQMTLAFLTTTGFRPRAYPDDRRRLAQRLVDEVAGQISQKDLKCRSAKGLASEMAPESVADHLAETVLDLLEDSEEIFFIEECSRLASDLVNEEVEKGRWDRLVYLWNELSAIEAQASSSEKADLCRKARSQFWHPENITRITGGILTRGLKNSAELADILRELARHSAELMVKALCEATDEGSRRVLADLVAELYGHTRDFVLAAIVAEDGAFALEGLVAVVRKARDKGALTLLENLLAHKDSGVRVAALSALTELGHPNAARHIVSALSDPDPAFALGAIPVAGTIHDAEVIEALLNVVRDDRLLKVDYDMSRKREAVKALAFIGSQEALPVLLKLLSSKKLFNAKEFGKLKVDIFRSLDGYDPEKLGPFIELGVKSGDVTVAGICENLRIKMEGARKAK